MWNLPKSATESGVCYFLEKKRALMSVSDRLSCEFMNTAIVIWRFTMTKMAASLSEKMPEKPVDEQAGLCQQPRFVALGSGHSYSANKMSICSSIVCAVGKNAVSSTALYGAAGAAIAEMKAGVQSRS